MVFSFVGIDHVQLAAPEGCEEEARSFYSGLLGWEEIPKPDNLVRRGGVWFRCGTHEVHIGVQPDFAPAKKAHPGFRVQGLASLRKHLEQKGIQVIDDEPRDGFDRFYMHDPFGNRLEFLEYR